MQYPVLVVNFLILLLTPSYLFAYDEQPGFFNLNSQQAPSMVKISTATAVPATQTWSPPPDEPQTSEVVSSPTELPTNVPTPQPKPSRPTTAAKPQSKPQTPSTKPQTKDYSLRSLGIRSSIGGESLSTLQSCGSIKMILGKKPKSGREPNCDDVKIATAFAPKLMSYLPSCIQKAAQSKFPNKTISQSLIYNADAYRHRTVRGSKRWSLHATGRAFDIYQIDVKFTDGSKLNTPMTIAKKNDSFYKTFNACWREKMNTCDRGKGLIDCKDSDHRDHVHVSMPYCPSKSGISGT